jgi:hypothetical protein
MTSSHLAPVSSSSALNLEHPQPMFLPQCERPSFTPIQNNRQNYSSVCSVSVFRQEPERLNILKSLENALTEFNVLLMLRCCKVPCVCSEQYKPQICFNVHWMSPCLSLKRKRGEGILRRASEWDREREKENTKDKQSGIYIYSGLPGNGTVTSDTRLSTFESNALPPQKAKTQSQRACYSPPLCELRVASTVQAAPTNITAQSSYDVTLVSWVTESTSRREGLGIQTNMATIYRVYYPFWKHARLWALPQPCKLRSFRQGVRDNPAERRRKSRKCTKGTRCDRSSEKTRHGNIKNGSYMQPWWEDPCYHRMSRHQVAGGVCKVKIKAVLLHDKQAQRGGRGTILSILHQALEGDGQSALRPSHFTPGKETPVPIVQEAG